MTQLSAGLQTIFTNSHADFQRRVDTLAQAVDAIGVGNLEEDLRAAAEGDAHKLAGSLGTFGLARGSELARELELRLAPNVIVASTDVHLVKIVTAIREEIHGRLVELRPLDPEYAVHSAVLDAPAAARILVVDDDPPVLDVLVEILSDAGYDVRKVGSAAGARRALAHERIDLLLSDVSMPGETGIDLVRFALCEHPETATLLISAGDDPAVAQVAINFGAYGYLSKPVRRTEVLIGVMNALRRRDMEVHERATRENLERIVELRTTAVADALTRVEAAAARGRVLQAETIHRWAQSAEHRDPGIGRHVKRVSHYCALLSDRFGLHAESISLASALHDVGKHAIPDSILLKPGPLTAAERLAVETHSEVGYEMLSGSCSRLLDLAAVIARTHHEKFDGSGYPRGLSGESIPLEGRIAAVADVFDALTSDRIYRPAWSVEAAFAWMSGERGRHFDPEVLDAFASSIDEVRAVHSLLTDV